MKKILLLIAALLGSPSFAARTLVGDTLVSSDYAKTFGFPTASTNLIGANGTIPFTADQSHGGFKITNVADPVALQDVATKNYVDSTVAAIDIKFTSTVYVAKNGSDITGDGSLNKPYLTVAAAMASITTASPTNRFAIFVYPGRYTETGLTIKANVFVVGYSYFNTRIANNVAIVPDATFTPAGDNRSGFVNINIASQLNMDMAAVSSNEGKIYVTGCQLAGGAVFTAFSNINQGFLDDDEVFGGITQTGWNLQIKNSHINSGDVVVNPLTGGSTTLDIQSSSLEGNATVGTNTADSIQTIFKGDFLAGTATFNGAGVSSSFTNSFLSSSPVVLNGAAITLLSVAQNEGYTPTTPADWSVVPNNVRSGLDTLAADRLRLDGSNTMTGALNMGTHTINNVVDPSTAQQAATKNYVDTHNVPNKQTFTLSGTDITNQYVDLAFIVTSNSVGVIWDAGLPPLETSDYTLSTVGGVTRVSFVVGGTLNTAALAGQKLQISYLH